MQVFRALILLTLLWSCGKDNVRTEFEGVPFTHMESEPLPPLNTARTSHVLAESGGKIVAIGGHTTGFLTTPTAEYYSGGSWRQIPTLYAHDGAWGLRLKDGALLVGGGYHDNFGIGQTWGVERYDPSTHKFTPMPVMDRKRSHASATELPDGGIVISGNWFAPDATEFYPQPDCSREGRPVNEQRSFPLILPTGPERIWIFGGFSSNLGESIKCVVDDTAGSSFLPPLFETWRPQAPYERNIQPDYYNIGPWTYLLVAEDSLGRKAAMKVDPEGFSILENSEPLPQEGPWGAIRYGNSFWVDRTAGTAWISGRDAGGRLYLAALEYGAALEGGTARIQMYYSDPYPDLPEHFLDLRLDDGTFAVAGGSSGSNYEPSGAAFIFYPEGRAMRAEWLWLCLLAGVLMSAAIVLGRRASRPAPSAAAPAPTYNGLAGKLVEKMEKEQLYKRQGLKIGTLASEVGTNTTYVSACLSKQMGTSFHDFVTGYRIEHACRLMRENPSTPLSQISAQSGFSNEKTFLRTFKAHTGLTPTEWKSNYLSNFR